MYECEGIKRAGHFTGPPEPEDLSHDSGPVRVRVYVLSSYNDTRVDPSRRGRKQTDRVVQLQ